MLLAPLLARAAVLDRRRPLASESIAPDWLFDGREEFA